jgi:D-3-phosphoglycerate dehydrogenase
MKKVLANDGIHITGQKMLEAAGYTVDTEKISQEELPSRLNDYDAICVRSATKVRQDLIDQCPNLKVIARGGVGMDNIDVDYAKSKGLAVYNTPAASSRSVAELAFGHLFSLARFVYKSNRNMPADGDSEFKTLKKSFSKGIELKGKKIGIIGFGRIGQETAKIALGLGMEVLPVDPYVENTTVQLDINKSKVDVNLSTVSMDTMLAGADMISLHIPFTGSPVLAKEQFDKMKDGMIIVNCARGGTIDEDALLEALDSGKVASAGLDVFVAEPTPRKDVLEHPKISLTPHIGASTAEAQENIGIELAEQIIAYFQTA